MREEIFDFLRREMVGPDPIPPFVQDNGEEILTNEPPRLRYGAGILFPQAASNLETDSTDEKEKMILEEGVEVPVNETPLPVIEEAECSSGGDESADSNDDIINLANSYLPSVMGFSCFVEMPEAGFCVTVNAGRYLEKAFVSEKMGKPSERPAYFREPLNTMLEIPKGDLPNRQDRSRNFPIIKNGKPSGLVINITNRSSRVQAQTRTQLLTFSLVNTLNSSAGRVSNESCFFQVGFGVKSRTGTPCFIPYPEQNYSLDIKDEESTRLLYRNYRTYAVGHGCAPVWIEDDNGKISEIRAEVLPYFEMKPVVPATFPDVQLKMYDLSDLAVQTSFTSNLVKLTQRYEEWIVEQEVACSNLEQEFRSAAERHLQECRKCLSRINDGIDLIRSEADVRRAFCLMNRAMLVQQLRYRLKLREWEINENRILQIQKVEQPHIHKPETWPDWSPGNGTRLGSWYPFQIAFILMNLRAIAEPQNENRKVVDLIWFPTGGGKTEAYLGLSAFSIFLKRLRNKNDSGTTVLMRYTLRLLTAQQYQRAASLICACESIRLENKSELGSERITIGLWVGSGLTPNKRAEAFKAFNDLSQGKSTENPFIILKCPWCGAQMGPLHVDRLRIIGYKKRSQPSTVVFKCHNSPECAFSSDESPLPLLIIDEDIYETPPSILIGTVDKFAMLPWKQEARTLFGFREGKRISPPELIIQDELHLISGPLGSMAGHYETLIYELCKNPAEKSVPKIIASTATITRAAQQIHSLYGCGEENVFLLPPQGLEAGNSFFAYEDKNSAGRAYVGVHASGLPSHTTAQVRIISALLQGTKSTPVDNENMRNPYWTLVTYFNSLRELGHAATLIRADIREHLNAMWIRKGIRKEGEKDPRRFINKAIELTSRVSSVEIPQKLQELEINYPQSDENLPVDICLATNMISVGVDVQRLGLMAVVGQPKTTSEYIQATSRVGRSKEGPGLVVVIFNTAKPRDRSHYEHFYSYHSAIYSHVEPTSVTPFSAPVRERALHAILVGLIRFFGSVENRKSPQPLPAKQVFDSATEVIKERVSIVDSEELELTLKLLKERIDEWVRHLPPKYGDFYQHTDELQLMYPAGTSPPEEWQLKSWSTPTSLRSVDAICDAAVLARYPEQEVA